MTAKLVDENLFHVKNTKDVEEAMHKAGFFAPFEVPTNIVYPSLCTFFLSNNDIGGYQVICRHWSADKVLDFLGDW